MWIDPKDPQCDSWIVETLDGFAHSVTESWPDREAAARRYDELVAGEQDRRRKAFAAGRSGEAQYGRIALYQLIAVMADDNYMPGDQRTTGNLGEGFFPGRAAKP